MIVKANRTKIADMIQIVNSIFVFFPFLGEFFLLLPFRDQIDVIVCF